MKNKLHRKTLKRFQNSWSKFKKAIKNPKKNFEPSDKVNTQVKLLNRHHLKLVRRMLTKKVHFHSILDNRPSISPPENLNILFIFSTSLDPRNRKFLLKNCVDFFQPNGWILSYSISQRWTEKKKKHSLSLLLFNFQFQGEKIAQRKFMSWDSRTKAFV